MFKKEKLRFVKTKKDKDKCLYGAKILFFLYQLNKICIENHGSIQMY